MSNITIEVQSEFAPLQTVILTQSEFGFPDKPSSEEELAFLPEDARQLFRGKCGADHGVLFPQRQQQWEKERENFKAVLEKHSVNVLLPRKLTKAEKDFCDGKGYSNFFVRDPIFTVGTFVIEGSMRFLHRRQEVLPVRTIVDSHIMESECSYLAVPQPEVYDPADPGLGKGPYLEGGDVLVLGKHVFVGSSGLASNNEGARWLAKLLKPAGYTVEFVPLKETILHLDCALSLVREGLMIVCESALLNGVPESLKNWDRINIDESDCAQLTANGLPLNEKVYVCDPFFTKLANKLDGFGIDLELIDFSVSRAFGGSFRCSTQPLLRK